MIVLVAIVLIFILVLVVAVELGVVVGPFFGLGPVRAANGSGVGLVSSGGSGVWLVGLVGADGVGGGGGVRGAAGGGLCGGEVFFGRWELTGLVAVKAVAVVLCFWDESRLWLVIVNFVVVVSRSYYCCCRFLIVVVVRDFAEELAVSGVNAVR